MSDEKRKPKNENRKRKPNPSSDPIRSDGSRSPVPRSSARALGVCTYINSFKSGYPISVCSNASGRVDRKGSGRVDRSIDRSKRVLESGRERVLESIDRSIDRSKRVDRVGSGRVGSRWVPAARRPALRARRVDVDDERRHGTRARNSRTRGRRNFSRLSSATSRDFSRRRARTLADSRSWTRSGGTARG